MEERRIVRIGESMKTYAEVDRQVIPIIGKCLDGIVKAAESIDQKNVSVVTSLLVPPTPPQALTLGQGAATVGQLNVVTILLHLKALLRALSVWI